MNLALAIVFFWIGCALLAVAFHPLSGSVGGPQDVFTTLQKRVGAQNSAYTD